MNDIKIIKNGAQNAIGVLAYVIAVGAVMVNGDRLFGSMNEHPLLGIIAFLMLFLFSALVTGGLVLGQPLIWFLQGDRKEGVKLFFYTAGWLAAFTLVALLLLPFVIAISS